MKYSYILLLLLLCINSNAQQPSLLLAKVYHSDIEINDYWVSEKLDGVRAYWNGTALISRQGHVFNAPQWFTQALPDIAIDGELWIDRNQFDKVSGLVRRQDANPINWHKVSYMIFDLPNSLATFDHRVKQMNELVQQANVHHFKAIKQFRVNSHQQLHSELDRVVSLGGEGLMLHKGSSYYTSGRSNDLLKLKKYFDAEATVMKHIAGKGKYKNMLGSMLVKTAEGIQFKIGTGFSDEERRDPPPVAALITYKYFGLTNKGKPRFASFMRIRKDISSKAKK